MESLGRRITLQISSTIFIVGAILQTAAPMGNLGYIYAGRVITGLACGGITGESHLSVIVGNWMEKNVC